MPGEKRRRIGFVQTDNPEVEPLEHIKVESEEEEQEETPTTVMLEDYIPGAVYDAQGNIVTYRSFNAKVKKERAEARNLNLVGIGKIVFYISLASSILLLSYGAYKKYLNPIMPKKEVVKDR